MKIVKFSSKTCGPCKMMAPIVSAVCADLDIKLEEVDIEESPKRTQEMGVRAVPTTFLLDDEGNVLKMWAGVRSKSVFEKEVKMYA